MKAVCLLAGACLLVAGGELATPSAGYSRAADGTIIRVSGTAGAFVTSATNETETIAASFSGQLGVIKRASSIRVLDGYGEMISESDAPDGLALLGFNPKGDAAIVYYPSTQVLAVFDAGEWRPIPFDAPANPVLAVAIQSSDTALALALRDQLSLITIRISDGAIMDETLLGGGTGPALLLANRSVLFTRNGGLLYRDAGGTEQILDTGSQAILILSHMDSDWVHARAESGSNFAFRLESEIRIYELPGVPQ